MQNDVYVKDFKDGKPIAYRLTGTVKIANILSFNESKLLKLTVESPQLHVRPHGSLSQTEFEFHRSPLDNYQNNDFYGVWESGNISNIYYQVDENIALLNVKKSILSLFQFNVNDGDYIEFSESGRCDVSSRQISQTGVRKMKRNCDLEKKFEKLVRSEPSLQVSVQSHRSTDYEFFADTSVKKIASRDYFHIALEANREIGGSIDSIINLCSDENIKKVESADSNSPKEFLLNLKKYKSGSLEADIQQISSLPKSSVKKIINDNIDGLSTSNIGTLKAAKSFLKILPAVRNAKKSELVSLLKSTKLKKYVVGSIIFFISI